jgi:hypothetical protein
MNPVPDTTTADNGGTFDPRHAAALLDQTAQQTRRRLQPFPPWFLTIRGVGVLLLFGAVWLNVRGQHPYAHPTTAVVPVAIGFGILNLAATVALARRANAGVTGRTPLRPVEFAGLAAIWIAVLAVMGVLIANGISDSVVYGLYLVAAPLIAGGVGAAAVMAAHANWRPCCTAAASGAVGVVALFAGPAGAWAVAGVGLCLVLLASAAFIVWQQRRSLVRP